MITCDRRWTSHHQVITTLILIPVGAGLISAGYGLHQSARNTNIVYQVSYPAFFSNCQNAACFGFSSVTTLAVSGRVSPTGYPSAPTTAGVSVGLWVTLSLPPYPQPTSNRWTASAQVSPCNSFSEYSSCFRPQPLPWELSRTSYNWWERVPTGTAGVYLCPE